ncbi:transcription elongation factor GreB [Marinihelvus fidelis]|uniref:Transcription elongation factor GreB n=1 Tax=Marinihelvus fidelis TaxID=2613842 RepID=A0A5N0TAZ2_9GAMM|nr:transcription elongation factor GreB [Marinihelvus fidelis]KAA9131921.1 transcription elongation factor GreB [Marinihelvus fidelis]
MGRWRPPAKPSSPYITAEGAQALEQELKQLWRVERPEVVRALSAAAAEGDRSENAEYIYRKKQLGGIDRRIRYLTRRLDVIKVVDRLPDNRDSVRFGAWVTVADETGTESVYRIVGADETRADDGWISIDSPMARGLLGRGVGDTVMIERPDGSVEIEIAAIDYLKPGTDEPT